MFTDELTFFTITAALLEGGLLLRTGKSGQEDVLEGGQEGWEGGAAAR
jgi:hypothetical protein